MRIENQKVVTLEYTLTDDEGEILDTSKGDEPLVYMHGSGSIVPGLEKALLGKEVGDAVKVVVSPADGYGDRDEDLVQTVPREQLPAGEVDLGDEFHVNGPGEEGDDGHLLVSVVALDDTSATLDGNHPLAGVTLHFDVKVMQIRDATSEEIEHGHAHGGDGHHHH